MKFMITLIVLIALGVSTPVEAQIWKKVVKKAEEKAKDEVATQTEKKIDDVVNKNRKRKKKKGIPGETTVEVYSEKLQGGFELYTKFDFIPGDEILFYDDFKEESIGDFPSRWDGNGSGELVEVNKKKWFKLSPKTVYMPDTLKKLPKEFTVEFDIHAINFKESGGGPGNRFGFWIDDNKSYRNGKNLAGADISLWTAIKTQIRIKNRVNGKRGISNTINYSDFARYFFEPAHISVAVNKSRMRIWVNQKKIIDIPRLVQDADWKTCKLFMEGYNDPFLISDFKIATGNMNIQKELIDKGVFTTNAIQFDSGSTDIKPESYGTLKQIAEALQQTGYRILIIGHTDADGEEEENLILSEKRAMAVKNALVDLFNIDKALLSTEGKGATMPVADNANPEGKAQNRRVEFVKIE